MKMEKTVELQMILHCAPVIKGIKAANTIRLPKKQLMAGISLLDPNLIQTKILYCGLDDSILLLYRQQRLLHVLNEVNNCAYLLSLGYRPLRIEETLFRLSEKVKSYYNRKKEFPHELGIFLEYPLEDILEYQKQNGKNYIMSGYWKVYGQAELAEKIFETYEDAKKELLRVYLRTGEMKVEQNSIY